MKFIEKDEESPSKRKRNRKKKNMKNDIKEKMDKDFNRMSSKNRLNLNEDENSDQEIEEFIKKLKECSQYADKVSSFVI